MNCKDIETLMPLYLSGELEPPRARLFSQHVNDCQYCAAELQWQRQQDSVLRAAILSEEVDTAELHQRVRNQTTPKRSPWARFSVGLAGAGLAAAVLLGIAGYYAGFASPAPPLCVDAARDHRVEVTARQHRSWLTDPKAVAQLAEKTGISGSLLSRLAPPDYHLEFGKLCHLDGSLYLHLVYAKGTSEFSVYLSPAGNATPDQAIHETDTGHEYVSYLRTPRLTAVFVTGQSSGSAWAIARFASQAL